jgi:branched-chain amino acid transport system ATP-binding protein
MSLLSVRDVVPSYGKVTALRGMTLNVGRSELVCLVGANGAGKTTLMKVIMGLLPAANGSIEFAGRSLLGMRTHGIARLGIAWADRA